MTWDSTEIQLQAYIHHFLHIILCDTKSLTYPSKVASILIKRANISWCNPEEEKTAHEPGFCLCSAVSAEAYLS